MTPVLLAFWTTSDFTPQAKQCARELGIWHLNGIGLAQLAIRVGLSEDEIAGAEAEALRVADVKPS
ncbi:MAG: hypothetical protein ACLQU3_02975 [Limisphaerales bacterium]